MNQILFMDWFPELHSRILQWNNCDYYRKKTFNTFFCWIVGVSTEFCLINKMFGTIIMRYELGCRVLWMCILSLNSLFYLFYSHRLISHGNFGMWNNNFILFLFSRKTLANENLCIHIALSLRNKNSHSFFHRWWCWWCCWCLRYVVLLLLHSHSHFFSNCFAVYQIFDIFFYIISISFTNKFTSTFVDSFFLNWVFLLLRNA